MVTELLSLFNFDMEVPALERLILGIYGGSLKECGRGQIVAITVPL